MKKTNYLLSILLFSVFQLNTYTNATENILDNEILNYINQEDKTIISTAQAFDISTNKVLSIYKQSNIIIESVINTISDNIVSEDKLSKLLNNIKYNMKQSITMNDIENIAYKSNNLANIINFIDIHKTTISKYHQSEKDILCYLNRTNTNMNIANFSKELKVNIPTKVILEIYLKSSPVVQEVYREVNKQYYQNDFKPNNFWISLREKLQNNFNDKSYVYTDNFTGYINNILYKLDYPWYKFKEI